MSNGELQSVVVAGADRGVHINRRVLREKELVGSIGTGRAKARSSNTYVEQIQRIGLVSNPRIVDKRGIVSLRTRIGNRTRFEGRVWKNILEVTGLGNVRGGDTPRLAIILSYAVTAWKYV